MTTETNMDKTILFLTSNANKLREVRAILADVLPAGWTLASRKIDLDEVQSADPVEVAQKKARAAADVLRCEAAAAGTAPPRFVMVEDTCLCFDALGGLPGPFVRFFLERLGAPGLERLLHGYADRRGAAVCTLVLADLGADAQHVFQGSCAGTIVAPRGENHFGWDPIFEPAAEHQTDPAHPCTYAEMPAEHKNTFSHRRRALDALCAWITANKELFV